MIADVAYHHIYHDRQHTTRAIIVNDIKEQLGLKVDIVTE